MLQVLAEILNIHPDVLLGMIAVGGTTLGMIVLSLLTTPRGNQPTLKPLSATGGQPTTTFLRLAEKEEITHDTRRFRFALPHAQHVLGLPVGQHITLRFTDGEGKICQRSYTPVSSNDAVGYVDLVVKVYFKGVHPKFPEGGKMSQYLESLNIGDRIEVAGPKGKLTYAGNGEIQIKHRNSDPAPQIRRAKKIAMIAGGTGITPMLQIIRQALKDNDTTEFYLLFANQTEKDILLREEIDAMVSANENVHVWYTLDKAPEDWSYSVGYVNAEMIKEHLPAPGPDVQVLMCGPPPMLKFAVLPALEELGFTPDMHFSF